MFYTQSTAYRYTLLDDTLLREKIKQLRKGKLSFAWEQLLEFKSTEELTINILSLIYNILASQRFSLTDKGCTWNLYAEPLERQPPEPFQLPNGMRNVFTILNSQHIATLSPIKILEKITLECMKKDKTRVFPKRKKSCVLFYHMVILLYQFTYERTDKTLQNISSSSLHNLNLSPEERLAFQNLHTLIHADINAVLINTSNSRLRLGRCMT